MPPDPLSPPKTGSVGDITSALPILPFNQVISGLDAPRGQGLQTFGRGILGEMLGGTAGGLAGAALAGGKGQALPLLGLLGGAAAGGHLGRKSAKKQWPLVSRVVRD